MPKEFNPTRMCGTAQGYYRAKCRCPSCKKAWSKYVVASRKKSRDSYVYSPSDPHGEQRMYQRGCRCDDCVSANASQYQAWKNSFSSEEELKLALRKRLLRRYNVTPEHYETLLRAQSGACGLCPRVPEEGEYFAVDHDHSCCPGRRSCGECVRGLLCAPCNLLLGQFELIKSTPNLAEKMESWLKNSM